MKSRSNPPVCHPWFREGSRAPSIIPSRPACLLIFPALVFAAFAGQVDIARLPPPANIAVDFDRDVRPIFEQSCFRCHGPERPKSGFRLDNRESALVGGEVNFDDIIPGDSAHSHLIHYVARIVEEVAMPPAGKADPLTAEQVSLLRAWIDQGASWGVTNTFPQLNFSATSMVRWIDLTGDSAKFREIEGVKPGWGGGEEFSLVQQLAPDQRFSAEGRFLFPDHDYRLKLALEQTDVSFIRGGFETWRRYYDDTGGYYPLFSPPSFDLDRELHMDIGRAWIEFGITVPDAPRIVLGYELQFRDGTKSMLEWGPVVQNGFVRSIYPASKNISERTHILKLDLSYDVDGWHLEDNARIEFFSDRTGDRQITAFTTGPNPDAFIRTHQDFNHVQGANVLRVEKQITDHWFGSGGYLYSRLEGDSSLNQSTVDAANTPVFGSLWRDQVTLLRETHAFSVASLVRPIDALNVSMGVQTEFTHQEGFGDISLDVGIPDAPFLQPATVRSDLDETKVSENIGLRYTRVPFTVLFAEGRFAQDRIGQFEQEAGTTTDVFLRDTDYANHQFDCRAGFNTSPWRWLALNAHYRRRDSDSDYDHLRDESPLAGEGYSAFIRHREIVTDEVELKLVLHPALWLKTSLIYRWTDSDYFTATDPIINGLTFPGTLTTGEQLLGGSYRANVYGLNVTIAPSPRISFFGTLTYSDSQTVTWAQNEVGSVAPYEGGTWTLMASANYAVNTRTALQAAYMFSRSDYEQNNFAQGLPLGLDYARHGLAAGITRQLAKRVTGALRYHFYRYTEPSTGGLNDYTAHGVFATVAFRWP